MLDENLKKMSCKCKEYYKSITSIDVIPVEKTNVEKYLKHRKGEKIIKKRLLRSPVMTTVKEDIYEYYDSGKLNAKELARHLYIFYDEEKNEFFTYGKVKIYFGEKSATHSFTTNEELKSFVDDLVDKCKKCGNELL